MQVLQGRMQQGTGDTKAMADTLDVLGARTLASRTGPRRWPPPRTDPHGPGRRRQGVELGREGDDGRRPVRGRHAEQAITAAEGMETLGKATSRTAEEAARLTASSGNRDTPTGNGPTGVARRPGRQGAGGVRRPDGRESRAIERRTHGQPRDRLAHLTQVEQGRHARRTCLRAVDEGGGRRRPAVQEAPGYRQDAGRDRKLYAATKTIGVKRRLSHTAPTRSPPWPRSPT
ncbi:MAG: hypothetical protein WKF75_09955 [Singulisphaera sp.]